jgi:hypothetical protein
MLIYLIGCLLGFGLTYTLFSPIYKDNWPMLCLHVLGGAAASWLTVLLFVFLLLVGVWKGVRGNED